MPQPPDQRTTDPPDPTSPPRSAESSPVIIPSEDLFRGRGEVWIEHGEMMYRLRRTSSGKLYLCK
ncbi:hemin uptake protein HemP [Stieleria mannarensis]|uniref:hemin uptake protein HemP n=1 Tax=Stieleria mannarensis TaxID=2755585 RepID=UPI001603C2E4|nr:hemin uptake protein HemP [Rhodopirellula sp. JC639]